MADDEMTRNESNDISVKSEKKSIWTKEELDQTLYAWDEVASRVVTEIHKPIQSNDSLLSKVVVPTTTTTTTKKDPKLDNEIWELDLADGNVPVILFYAPWCPHCQAYKPYYIELAEETQRRLVETAVQFYAFSCELYGDMCNQFNIDSYPTMLGWKISGDNPIEFDIQSVLPDVIAEELDFQLAFEDNNNNGSNDSNNDGVSSLDDKSPEEKIELQKQQARSSATLKQSWMQYQSSLNDRYHDAAMSLIKVLKTGIYAGINHDRSLETKRYIALQDFLHVIDWTTPTTWNIRSILVNDLITKYNSLVTESKRGLINVVEESIQKIEDHNNNGDRLLGSIDKHSHHRESLGVDSPISFRKSSIFFWTDACTHGKTAMGHTCGLWELLHIITIGASYPMNQLYGFRKGYVISPHEVAESIRHFIENFFACDICRRHFIHMYDSCGRDHCKRLSNHATIYEIESPNNKKNEGVELALWLWEVHNDVNIRIMKENALLQGRNVTIEEINSSKFPSTSMCEACWLDKNMEQWDSTEVFLFLEQRYWPKKEITMKSIFQKKLGKTTHDENTIATGGILTEYFGIFVVVPFVLLTFLIFCDTKKSLNILSFLGMTHRRKSTKRY